MLVIQLSLISMKTNRVAPEWGCNHFGAIPFFSMRTMLQESWQGWLCVDAWCEWVLLLLRNGYGLFTLHGNGTRTSTGNGKQDYIVQKCSHWFEERNQDPLFPIVLVPFPVPVPVPLPCSVNKPSLHYILTSVFNILTTNQFFVNESFSVQTWLC